MKLLSFIALFAFAALASANPFVVWDVAAGVAQCGVYLDAAAKVTIPAASLQCKYDLAGVASGSHTVKATAITANDPVWGALEGAQSAPFSFSRPAVPPAPTGAALTP